MSRKSDPKASALAYFATVPLDEARETLALVKEVLRQRQPKTKAARKPKPSPGLHTGIQPPPH